MIVLVDHNFYYSLTVAGLYEAANEEQRAEYDAILQRNQNQMHVWVESCPENFQQHYLLVEAERARLADDPLSAMQLYDDAIATAERNGFTQVEALAAELAGDFWKQRGKTDFADSYYDHAREAYLTWGAKRLTRRLLAKRDAETEGIEDSEDGSHEGSTASQSLDIAAVRKAANTLSGEIILDRLLRSLMNIILESAGADAGALILKSDEGFVVQAYKQPEASDPEEKRAAAVRYADFALGQFLDAPRELAPQPGPVAGSGDLAVELEVALGGVEIPSGEPGVVVAEEREDLDLARERTVVLQEELLSQVAQEQNTRMYVLSVVAAIFLPLTFVTGLLGMNVGGLPGLESPTGFTWSIIVMVVAAIGLLLFFRFKRWL